LFGENGLCGVAGTLERRGDDSVEADVGKVVCRRSGLQVAERVERRVELTLDDSSYVLVGLSMAYNEHPKATRVPRWLRWWDCHIYL
jgi:hypothetical protein